MSTKVCFCVFSSSCVGLCKFIRALMLTKVVFLCFIIAHVCRFIRAPISIEVVFFCVCIIPCGRGP